MAWRRVEENEVPPEGFSWKAGRGWFTLIVFGDDAILAIDFVWPIKVSRRRPFFIYGRPTSVFLVELTLPVRVMFQDNLEARRRAFSFGGYRKIDEFKQEFK